MLLYSGLILVSMKVMTGSKIGDLNDHHPMCTLIDFLVTFNKLLAR